MNLVELVDSRESTMWKRAVAPSLALCFFILVGQRIWQTSAENGDPMSGRTVTLSEQAERTLYLTPAGAYTRADIAANGTDLPSRRYRGFQAQHDFNPQPGDLLCPITRTKANPACTWIIGGQTYYFCCPPCIDELVRLAKEQPERLSMPDSK